MDLANTAKRLQEASKLRPAYGNPDAIVTLGQGAHHVPAEETRATVDSDQGVIGAACGHAALNFLPGRDASKPGKYRIGQGLYRAKTPSLTSQKRLRIWSQQAQVAELVDALVSGTSGESRGGSSSSPGHHPQNWALIFLRLFSKKSHLVIRWDKLRSRFCLQPDCKIIVTPFALGARMHRPNVRFRG